MMAAGDVRTEQIKYKGSQAHERLLGTFQTSH